MSCPCEAVGEESDRVAGIDKSLQRCELGEGLRLRSANHGHDARQNHDLLRLPTRGRHGSLQRRVLCSCFADLLDDREDHVPGARRQRNASSRAARLQHHRVPLGRAADVGVGSGYV